MQKTLPHGLASLFAAEDVHDTRCASTPRPGAAGSSTSGRAATLTAATATAASIWRG